MKRKIRGYTWLVILFILSISIVILMPFIILFAHIITAPFGEPVSYIATSILGNLYVPLITLFIMLFIFFGVKVRLFNIALNKMVKIDISTQHKISKEQAKYFLVVLMSIGLFVFMSFQGFMNIYHLTLDIGNLANSDFAKMDGTLTLYEIQSGDTSEYRMMVNNVKFSGGYVHGVEPIEGHLYHVEYLPHSMYIVKYELKQ